MHILLLQNSNTDDLKLKDALTAAKYEFTTVHASKEVLDHIEQKQCGVLVLDAVSSGLLVLQRLGLQKAGVPVLVVGADDMGDVLAAFRLGADDYVRFPFDARELIARLSALLRRNASVVETPERGKIIRTGDLVIDLLKYRVVVQGKEVHLAGRQFSLLATMASRPGVIFSRADLLSLIWGDEIHVIDRNVDVQVKRLRKALGSEDLEKYIATRFGVGYFFRENNTSRSS